RSGARVSRAHRFCSAEGGVRGVPSRLWHGRGAHSDSPQRCELGMRDVTVSAKAVMLSARAVILSARAVILSARAVILSARAVILSARAVILSAAKDLLLRVALGITVCILVLLANGCGQSAGARPVPPPTNQYIVGIDLSASRS